MAADTDTGAGGKTACSACSFASEEACDVCSIAGSLLSAGNNGEEDRGNGRLGTDDGAEFVAICCA